MSFGCALHLSWYSESLFSPNSFPTLNEFNCQTHNQPLKIRQGPGPNYEVICLDSNSQTRTWAEKFILS